MWRICAPIWTARCRGFRRLSPYEPTWKRGVLRDVVLSARWSWDRPNPRKKPTRLRFKNPVAIRFATGSAVGFYAG
jgi:hypothetical protein